MGTKFNWLVTDGSHTEDVYGNLEEAQFELWVRYDLFKNSMFDCYYTPELSGKKIARDKGFTFYGLNDDGTPDLDRVYLAEIKKVPADEYPVNAWIWSDSQVAA